MSAARIRKQDFLQDIYQVIGQIKIYESLCEYCSIEKNLETYYSRGYASGNSFE